MRILSGVKPNWLPTGLRIGSRTQPFGQLKGEFMQKFNTLDLMIYGMNTSVYLLGALLIFAGLPLIGVALAAPFVVFRIK